MSTNTNLSKDYGYISEYIFRLLFTASVGPLALSIIFMRNSLVFHDLNSISILALHWSPNIAIWGQRWFTSDLNNTFPNVFHIGCNCNSNSNEYLSFYDNDTCDATFIQLWVIPTVLYIFAYSIPFGIIFFYFLRDWIKKNNLYTNYSIMKSKPPLKELLNMGIDISMKNGLVTTDSSLKPVKYSFIHGFLCCLSFLLGPLLWGSFILHTFYLIVVLIIATLNGSTFYMRAFSKIKTKEYLRKNKEKIIKDYNNNNNNDGVEEKHEFQIDEFFITFELKDVKNSIKTISSMSWSNNNNDNNNNSNNK